MGEWLLGPLRDFAQPWYETHPRSVTFVFVVLFSVLATLLGMVLFHALFLKKAESPASPSASGTTINFGGVTIERLTVEVQGSTPIPPTAPSPAVPALLENGDFERGLHGWGTGFYESLFLQPGDGRTALGFMNARARWYVDDRKPHNGRRSLRVEHDSPYAPNVFSSFSQRIKVSPSTSYRVKFWVFIESIENGSFSLRVVPSRRPKPQHLDDEWDKFKRKADPAVIGRWQERTVEFESGTDWFFDLRFTAEGPIRAWVDDVTVVPVQG